MPTITAPTLTMSFMQGSRRGTQCALWLPDLAVLFAAGIPLAFVHRGITHVRKHINTRQVRQVAQWLAENHFPEMSSAMLIHPDDIAREVLRRMGTVAALHNV